MSKAMIATVTRIVLLAELIPDPGQLARHTPERVQQLAGDMAANGLHQAVGVLEDKRLIYGHGRYAAAKSLGWKDIEAKIYPSTLNETQWKIIRATENMQRTDLRAFEKWQTALDLLRLNTGWSQKDLAAHLHLSEAMIVRLLSPSKCITSVQNALQTGCIGIKAAYEISQAPVEEQAALLAAKLSGSSAEEVAHQRRRGQNGSSAPQVRMSRVKVAMPGGASVVISGKELSMAQVVELLTETVKEARRAAEQYDVKTWIRMMADKAK